MVSSTSAHHTRAVTATALVATLGGLLFGYDTAVISGAVGAINHNFIDPRGLSETAAHTLSGFTIGAALIGTIIGAMIAGWAADRFGRKKSMLIAALLFLVSAVGSAYPEAGFAAVGEMGPAAIVPFIIYRLIGGIGVGIASMISPMYIAEISPSAIRGRLVTFQQIAIVGGMVIVYFVNWGIAVQGDDAWVLETGWRYMMASMAIPAGLFFMLSLTVPESPRWLVLQDRTAEAQQVLARFNDAEKVPGILEEIRGSLREKSEPLFTYGALVIIVGIMLSVFQQLVGINSVLYYAPSIFKTMGFATDASLLNTVIIGAVNVIFTLVVVLTVDKLGRKPLLITGAIIMGISMIALGSLFNAQNSGLLALLAICVYLAGFALSFGPVVWVMLAEIFPNSIRGPAMSIAVTAQWIANWVVSTSFPIIDGNSYLNEQFNHGFAYWMYGIFSFLAAWFVFRFVPETKGVHLEDMGTLWRDHGGKIEAVTATPARQSG